MNTSKIFRNMILCAFCVCLIPPVAAWGGKVKLTPSVTVYGQVDDNYHKTDGGERTVYTYGVTPGISLGYEVKGKTTVSIDYTPQLIAYQEQDDASGRIRQKDADNDDFLGHKFVLAARTVATDRLTLGIDNSYMLTRTNSDSDLLSNETGRDKFWINRFTPMVYYAFNDRISAGVRYSNVITDYTQGRSDDSTEHRGIFDLVYTFPWEATLALDYQYYTRDYDGASSDYDSNQVGLIFNKQFRQFTLEAGAGYHWREFDEPWMSDQNMDTYKLGITWAPEGQKLHASLTSQWNFNDNGAGDQYYEAFKTTLAAGYTFAHKIPVEVSFDYQNSDYEDTFGPGTSGALTEREDDRYKVGVSVGYQFTDWMNLNLKAGHEWRESNWFGYDFNNTFGGIFLDFSYDLGEKIL